jgi:hypothetical protein
MNGVHDMGGMQDMGPIQWGEQANPQDTVYLAMWDDYLEPA